MMELWLTYGFCAIALVLSIAFALIKHPVHAALSFACVVLASAGVYLLQDAAFIAASTVVVYAGATIIIFMFVLMFAQQTNLLDYDTHKQNPIAAGIVAIALAATVIAVGAKEFPKLESQLAAKNAPAEQATGEQATGEPATAEQATSDKIAAADEAKPSDAVAEKAGEGDSKSEKKDDAQPLALEPSTPTTEQTSEVASADMDPKPNDRYTVAKLGAAFYTRYLLAIEIAGTLLLVATIGAVVIAQREPQADAKETTKS